jgi:hypothetical protein
MHQAYTDHTLKVRIDAVVAETWRLVRNTKEIVATVRHQTRIQRTRLKGQRLALGFHQILATVRHQTRIPPS